ncbi:unnamed protein product [Parnassius mnemosyne]|uniref:Luciferin 4-monooxygenase n=1 Tax=Parnassius mnemosyne TaxID=213953 RepID=A0AAV1KKV6_9NEOP
MIIKNNVVHGGPTLSIPAHLSYGKFVIDKLIEHNADENKIALVHGDVGEKTTYREILKYVVHTASGLKKLGVKRGDIVALCSENRLEFIVTALAAICCGATITTLSTQYTKDENKHVLTISKPSLLIASEEVLKQNFSIYKEVTYIKKFIQMNGKPIDNGIIAYKNVCAQVDAFDFEPEEVQGATDTLFLLYSSGTTGLPKGVMLTHVNALYAAANSLRESLAPESQSRSCHLTVVPWYHAYGLMTTINNFIIGRMTVYFPGFYPEKYLKAIEKYKVNVLLTVPPMIVFLTKSSLIEKYDMSSVTLVWCGAAPLSADTIRDVMKRLPNCKGVLQAYGMTETSTSATRDPERDTTKHKPGSGGTPLPGVRVKVVDVETRKKLGPFETGEICIKGPVVMKGYIGDKAADRDIMDEEGFLKTGDVGYYDHDGYFFIVERIKELIKYKGHQVPPATVESVILQHGSVAECGVVGAPDEWAGELPTAFVVIKPGHQLTERELLDFTASRLSPANRLHGGVIFVKEIPKNPSGKIMRRILKQRLQDKRKSKL